MDLKLHTEKNSMLLPPVGRISIISDFVCSTFLHCMDNYNFLGMAGHYIWGNMSLARYVFKMVGHSFKINSDTWKGICIRYYCIVSSEVENQMNASIC